MMLFPKKQRETLVSYLGLVVEQKKISVYFEQRYWFIWHVKVILNDEIFHLGQHMFFFGPWGIWRRLPNKKDAIKFAKFLINNKKHPDIYHERS
jgi:hypothetical protein